MSVRERQPHHHRVAGRLLPLSERRTYEQPTTTLPSWNSTIGMLDLRTRNNSGQRRLIRENRGILKEYYDARYFAATGNGMERINEFVNRYTGDETSEFHNPDLIDKLSPYFSIIRDSFPKASTRR